MAALYTSAGTKQARLSSEYKGGTYQVLKSRSVPGMLEDMARIKSALEIAFERTELVKSDKSSIGLYEAKQQGKRFANQYLAGETGALEAEIKKHSGDEQKSFRDGVFEVLVSQINLPVTEDEEKRVELAGKGLAALIGGRRFAMLYQQFNAAVAQYIDETARFGEAVKQQYAPKLRQKEEELARRFGRAVKLDPFQDPEFVAFYNQNLSALKANYEPLVHQMREEARHLFGETA